jgi:hypothetical protein
MKKHKKNTSQNRAELDSREEVNPHGDEEQTLRSALNADNLILVAFAIILVHAFYCWSVGWNQPIVDAHEFRQSQTAISCYYMRLNGLSVVYETPVMGPPWKIPFEFPFCHWAVALLSKTGIQLESAGRAISMLSFLVALVGVYVGSDAFFDHWRYRLLMITFALANSYLLFWSRSFMIEMTAVALGVWLVVFAHKYGRSGSLAYGCLAVLLACAAALQKITTFPAYHLLAVVSLANNWRSGNLSITRCIVFVVLLTLLPASVTKGWVDFADSLKSQNHFGQVLTSSYLTEWNYGTLTERLQLNWFHVLLDRMSTTIYHPTALVGAAVSLLLGAREHWRTYTLLIASFAAPLALFTPLFGHSYYLCANLLVASVLFSITICHMIQRESFFRYVGIGLVAIFICTGIYRSHALYLPLQRNPETGRVWISKAIRYLIRNDKILVGFGTGWSSVVPYYAERRALLLPSHPTSEDIEAAKLLMKNEEVGGLVLHIRNDEDEADQNRLMEEATDLSKSLGLSPTLIQLRSEWYFFPDSETQKWYDKLAKARDLFLSGNSEGSLALLQSLPPTFNDGLFMTASVHFEEGRPGAAIEALSKMVANLPGDPVTYAAAGEHVFKYAQIDSRYIKQAIGFLDKAIALEPYRSEQLYLLRSQMRQFAGDREGAHRDLEYAKEIPFQWRLDQNGDLARQVDYI